MSGDEFLIPVNQSALSRLFNEAGPEIRISNSDEFHGPLPDIFPMQIGDAVFRDHIVDVSPDQGCPRPLPEERYYPGNSAVVRRGWDGQDCPAVAGQHCPAHEVRLTADSAVEGPAQRLRRSLTGQINFQAGIDGRHVFVLGNNQGIVRIVDGFELNKGIIIDIFICFTFPHAEGGNRLSPVDRLAGVVDYSFFHQLDNTVGQ